MRDSKIFDEAVAKFFEPIARRLGLPLSKVREGIYDIPSPHFIVRIRLHTGHRRGLNVLLRPASLREFDEDKSGAEYGIGNFMIFEGAEWKEELVETDADFLKRAAWLAKALEQFGLPYLLGQGRNLDEIKEMVKQRTKEEVKRIENYHFPKNVRKEWF
jgi:hypothetical protein